MAKENVKPQQIVKWDEEMAKYADEVTKQEANVGGGQFFSIKSGVLQFNGAPLPGNEMAGIVLASVMENVYYVNEYDPDDPQPPDCYAFGTDDSNIKPHEAASDPQAEKCDGCPMNEWGSKPGKGKKPSRGKACRNLRRLAIIPAGTIDKQSKFEPFTDMDQYENATYGILKVPPTSLGSWAQYAKNVAAGLRLPPFAVFTHIKVVPDPKSQFKLVFNAISPVPDELKPLMLKRHNEALTTLVFPYAKASEAEAPSKPAAKRKY